jgi:apolipoprotein D and lipocalin family protein
MSDNANKAGEKSQMKTQVKAMLLAIGMSLFPSFLSFASTPLQLVPYVDLNRYMGDWHVIANIPNFIEKKQMDTRLNSLL